MKLQESLCVVIIIVGLLSAAWQINKLHQSVEGSQAAFSAELLQQKRTTFADLNRSTCRFVHHTQVLVLDLTKVSLQSANHVIEAMLAVLQ